MEPIPNLPNDLIVEILTWLPAKPLLKLRCVCRSWRTLISSKQFVRAHLEKSKSDRNWSSHRLIMERRGNLKQCSVNSVMYEPVSEAFDLNFPPEMVGDGMDILGSCNGLVCVLIWRPKALILWNPSTRIWKKLPDVDDKEYQYMCYYHCGFGFDESSNDYKVVGLFQTLGKAYAYKTIRVYSLRNDQWRSITNFCNDEWEWIEPSFATFANGKVYWTAYPNIGPEMCVYSFDLETEEDEIVKIPSYVKSGFYWGLGALKGSLLLFCNHQTSAELWMMDKSWTRLATIPYFDDAFECKEIDIVPLYVKHGRILLLGSPTLAIFDANDCSFRYPEVRGSVQFVAQASYLETLVSPLDPWIN